MFQIHPRKTIVATDSSNLVTLNNTVVRVSRRTLDRCIFDTDKIYQLFLVLDLLFLKLLTWYDYRQETPVVETFSTQEEAENFQSNRKLPIKKYEIDEVVYLSLEIPSSLKWILKHNKIQEIQMGVSVCLFDYKNN